MKAAAYSQGTVRVMPTPTPKNFLQSTGLAATAFAVRNRGRLSQQHRWKLERSRSFRSGPPSRPPDTSGGTGNRGILDLRLRIGRDDLGGLDLLGDGFALGDALLSWGGPALLFRRVDARFHVGFSLVRRRGAADDLGDVLALNQLGSRGKKRRCGKKSSGDRRFVRVNCASSD